MADSAILDYYRATDQGCSLRRIGETYVEDTYAIGMTKGFVLIPASTNNLLNKNLEFQIPTSRFNISTDSKIF